MAKEAVAKIYARALFKVARKRNQVEEWGKQLKLIEGILKNSKNLRVFLLTPGVDTKSKTKIIKRLSELGKFPNELMNFIRVLVKRRWLNSFHMIGREYFEMTDRLLGRLDVMVRSAVKLGEEEKDRLEKVLETRLQKKLRMRYQVDPHLIAGVVVRAGERVYDGSLRAQLERMRARMLQH